MARSASGETPPARNITDPFAHIRSAPPQQAPWRSPEIGQPYDVDDYFGTYHHAQRVPRPVSPLTALPIKEEDEQDEQAEQDRARSPTVSKSSSFLKPPEVRYGSVKLSQPTALRVDTSDMALMTPLPPPVVPTISRESLTPSPIGFRDSQEPDSFTSSSRKTRHKWWPHFLLPDPHLLYVTLFPTIHGFRDKSRLQKILAIIAVPPVLVYTLTLPVVDTEADEEEEAFKFPRSPSLSAHPDDSPLLYSVDPDMENVISARAWNRWLTGVQCIFAPVFLTFLFFRNRLFVS